MSRKIFKSGNSLVIALSKEMLAYLQLGESDEVHLRLDPEKRQILVMLAESALSTSAVDREFTIQVADFIEEYRPALEELGTLQGH